MCNRKSGDDRKEENDDMLVLMFETIKYLVVWSNVTTVESICNDMLYRYLLPAIVFE